MGIYALWLTKRWVKYLNGANADPRKFGDLMQKMYYLAKEMGHVPAGVTNVMQLLEVTHSDYPYFDIKKELKDIVDEVRWKGKRLMKQVDREYSWATGVPSDFAFVRRPGDTVTRIITLDGYQEDRDSSLEIARWFPGFVNRSEQRTDRYNRLNLSPVHRYFFDLDTEDLAGADI